MPTSYAVLDSGILLATVQIEPYSEHANSLIKQLAEQQVQMIAPTLLKYELVAVARKWVYRELTTPEKAKTALNTLLHYPVTTIMDDALLHRAYELATEHNRPTAYDMQYVAVAERYRCDFWTADECLYNALNIKFTQIYWIGNKKLET